MNTIVRKYRVILLIHHPVSYENKKFGAISPAYRNQKIFKNYEVFSKKKINKSQILKKLGIRKNGYFLISFHNLKLLLYNYFDYKIHSHYQKAH